MKRRLLHGALIALLVISGGVGMEWILLTGSTPQSVIAAFQPTSVPIPIVYARPLFETGMAFPRWGVDAYTSTDPNYLVGLNEIQNQTAARWIELTINLYQATTTSTTISTQSYTPTPSSLEEGIRTAHLHGFRVFVEPLVTVGENIWSGSIGFTNPRKAAAWFKSYWQVLQPYLGAAAQAGADQFAVGTEFSGLEHPWATQWNALIAQAHIVFPGTLTYNVNFSGFQGQLPSWFTNPLLTYIGVSTYYSLTSNSEPVDPSLMPILWYDEAEVPLDNLAARLGKPLILSEIGYRDSSDAVYKPFLRSTDAPPDPGEQAGAYAAALQDTMHDPYIDGIFFWAWSLPPFSPNWLPAANVLHHWYTSPAA
ncbi:MAG: glycoside hydrolase family 113 [Ktedonobacterales bacterium]